MRAVKIGGHEYLLNGITREQAESVFNNLNSTINTVVGAANTLAGKSIYDLVEWMQQDKKLFRLQVKHYATLALKEFKAYERIHYRNFGNRYSLFIDYLDTIEEAVTPDVEKLYWSSKMVMDKLHEPKSDLFAKVETAVIMTEISCAVYDRVLEITREQSGFDFDRFMRPGRLSNALHWLVELRSLICRQQNRASLTELVNDPTCNLAAKVLMRKLTDYDLLGESCKKALSYHPELEETLKGDDKKLLASAMESEP